MTADCAKTRKADLKADFCNLSGATKIKKASLELLIFVTGGEICTPDPRVMSCKVFILNSLLF